MIDAIEGEHRGKPVYAVGHSLGGYLSFLAAVRRPELFRAIVLLDAPVIGAFRGSMLGATKRLGIVDRVTPAGATRDRRSHWPSRDEAKLHFRSRRLFSHFAEDCLEDYVRHGLYDAPPREASRAGGLHRRRALGCRTPRRPCGDAAQVQPAHRAGRPPFPFEHPREAAVAVLQLLDELA